MLVVTIQNNGRMLLGSMLLLGALLQTQAMSIKSTGHEIEMIKNLWPAGVGAMFGFLMSRSNMQLRDKQLRISMMMIPASNLEKFCATTICYVILPVAIFIFGLSADSKTTKPLSSISPNWRILIDDDVQKYNVELFGANAEVDSTNEKTLIFSGLSLKGNMYKTEASEGKKHLEPKVEYGGFVLTMYLIFALGAITLCCQLFKFGGAASALTLWFVYLLIQFPIEILLESTQSLATSNCVVTYTCIALAIAGIFLMWKAYKIFNNTKIDKL